MRVRGLTNLAHTCAIEYRSAEKPNDFCQLFCLSTDDNSAFPSGCRVLYNFACYNYIGHRRTDQDIHGGWDLLVVVARKGVLAVINRDSYELRTVVCCNGFRVKRYGT
jgi:hypothetical protein